MASPVERKVRQLDNDVQSIYELLASIEATQKRHGNRLGEIAVAQTEIATEHTVKLDEIRATQAEHTVKLDQHTVKLDEIRATQAEHTVKLDSLMEKVDTILELLRGNQPG